MRTLLATDLGTAADRASRAAVAGEHGALAVVHVLPHLLSVRPLFPHLAAPELAQLVDLPSRCAEVVGRHMEQVLGLAPGTFEVFIEQGEDYAEIVRRAESWKADRIVLGAHGRAGLARLFGGVADRVARYAPCDVFVHRESPEDGVVLAATDLSDPSVPAIEAGAAEAARLGAPLLVVHALDFGAATMASRSLAPFGAVSAVPSSAFDQARDLAREIMSQHLERLGVAGEVIVADGPAANVVVRLAEERNARMVVVGTRGRTGLLRIALGSVAERILRAAPCSVLVVRLGIAPAPTSSGS